MNSVLTDQLHDVLAEPGAPTGLACESSLRVAASMLAHSPSYDMTATRVVGVLGRDDEDAFGALVLSTANEYGLYSYVELRGGSFAVRFTR
jgi:hypothetical protein